MNLRACGDSGVLVELADLDEVLALYATLRDRDDAGITELVPASRTLLVHLDPAVTSTAAVGRLLDGLEPRAPAAATGVHEVEIPVTYDGEDLEEVGRVTGLGAAGVVEAHTGQRWTVGFVGFAPGFGYLVGEDARLRVPRRPHPRPAVPAGAVGLADEFSGVYPRRSPGGWQLIGRTDTVVWDEMRDPPGLLQPGAHVRFVVAG